MLLVRPATLDDVDSLFELVQLSELGLSTLKVSRDRLHPRDLARHHAKTRHRCARILEKALEILKNIDGTIKTRMVY